MKDFKLTRRRLLAGAGGIGLASTAAGLGTSAYLSDTESFTGNSITAGTLDVVVDYETAVTQDGVNTGSTTSSGELSGSPAGGTYVIESAAPGDSGYLEFCPKVLGNPGWVFVGSDGLDGFENGQTEPEEDVDYTAGGPDDGAGAGELAEAIEVTVSYVDSNGAEIRELNNPDWYTLRDLVSELTSGFLLDGDDASSGAQAYPASSDSDDQQGPCVRVDWEIPPDVGNEIQGDSVEFDVQFAAIQERNNANPASPFVDAVVADDGSGDFSSIQSAVNAVGEGGTVFVRDGTYEEQVVIGYDDLTLVGESRDGVVITLPSSPMNIAGGNGYEVVTVSPAAEEVSGVSGGDASLLNESWWRSSRGHYEISGVTLRNFTVDGDGQSSNRGLYFVHAQAFDVANVVSRDNGDKGSGNGWSRNGRFTDVVFENNVDDGITLFRSDGYTLRNVTAENNGDDGIDVHGNDHTLVGCTATNNGQIESGAGIEFTQGEGNVVTRTETTDNDVGVYVEKIGSASGTPSAGDVEVYVNDNDITGNTTGLQLDTGNDADVTVNANRNWWGDGNGPGGPDGVGGSGDSAEVLSGALILASWRDASFTDPNSSIVTN